MDLEVISPSRDMVKCCNCGCSCASMSSSSGTWLRSVKRKYDEFENENRFFIPDLAVDLNPRVQIENECTALRETVASQQKTMQDLYMELDEERNASSSAANEAMSMILRLQREKAEVQMEARQFKRFAEEKISHDQQELLAFEDLLYKREQAIQALTCEVQAYKHRMMSYGITEAEAEADGEKLCLSRNTSTVETFDAQLDLPVFEYPPLKCNLNENSAPLEGDDSVDVEIYPFGETPRGQNEKYPYGETPRGQNEKYPYGETPRGQNRLMNLEYRIHQMDRTPRKSQLDRDFSSGKNIFESVIVGQSPRRHKHSRRFSNDSSSSYMGMFKETGSDFVTGSPRFNRSFKKMEQTEDFSTLRKRDNTSEIGDEMSDRVYTIDSVHNGVQYNSFKEPKYGVGMCEDDINSPRDSLNRYDTEDPYIKKLYMRLRALEADRESMRQAIMSMRTDKAQMVLLKEIAQHLCKEMTPERQMPVRKSSAVRSFSLMSIFKWIVTFVFWRRKASRSKFTAELSANNVGLLMLLDKSPHMRQSRCVSSTQV
ncbi:myosin-binding protein 7-like isoform X2 [Mangifera indica]|uniref:myosin-binding protein 7-like isoform X2 n=1 Tax=Mangifera indica TaxID=29780 RepID=UPI001CFA40C6|nr:myosin-binding protein 7-like isoform X2 [Mangifera indica]